MIYLSEMTLKEQKMVKKLYFDSFPKQERRPFWVLLKLRRKKFANLLVIHDEDSKKPVGIAFFIVRGNLVLFDYYAMLPECRSKGYGSTAIEAIREYYKGKKIFGEVEAICEEAPNNDQRIRRLNFYLRNGLCESGNFLYLFGVKMQILYFEDEAVSKEEYLEFQRGIFGDAYVERFIRLLPEQ